ncbi:MAG TPA: hypothetical protein HPP56_10335 [Nitrospirae bacterium]|nr:hypothetical protein [Nitrospirota bacterium]
MIDKTKSINTIQENPQWKKNINNEFTGRTFHQILNNESQKPVGDEIVNKSRQTLINQQPISNTPKDYYKDIIQIVFKHEGKSLVKDDGGRESSKFGILASTAKQFGFEGELSQMNKADAEKIYKKLWDKSGAGNLPYPLSLIHFDTYVNSPSAAKRLLEKSQGDIYNYLDMREQRYKRLAELRPERFSKYLKGWTNRINNLRAIASEFKQEINLASNQLLIDNITLNITPLPDSKKPLL